MNKIEIGQKVILVEDGINSYRHNKNKGLPPSIYEATIIKVGRKYFTVSRDDRADWGSNKIEFNLDDLVEKTQYTPDYSLHFNREEYLNLLKIGESWNQLKRYFDRAYNAPKNIELSQLEQIVEILGLKKQ